MKTCAVVPVFHVSDLQRSLAYYVATLGFTKEFEWGNPVFYAGVRFGAPPRRYDYGMIDFKLADPDGNWVSFGEDAE